MSLSSDGTALMGLACFPVFRPPFRITLTPDDPLNPLTHSLEDTTVDDDEDAGELQVKFKKQFVTIKTNNIFKIKPSATKYIMNTKKCLKRIIFKLK
jgi:hypothetical protein